MELLNPVDELGEALKSFPKRFGESGQPQQLNDEPETLAKLLDRQRVTYEPVWLAAEKCYPKWQPVLCNSYRRALLLASSAQQHRTIAFEVWRRGRMVCVRLVPEPARATA